MTRIRRRVQPRFGFCSHEGGIRAARWRLFEEGELVGGYGLGNATVGTVVDPIDEGRIALPEGIDRQGVTADEFRLFPDLVEAARVAFIPLAEHPAGNAQPAGDPDIDGIGHGQRLRRTWRVRGDG